MSKKKIAEKLLCVVAGTFLMAMAVNFVYEPMNMVTGGTSGFAITVKALTKGWFADGIPVWFTNAALNIPIFIWAYFVKGKQYLCYTFFANLCFSFFMFLLPVAVIAEKDYVLATAMGSVLTGIGLGLVFATGSSTGGTDLLSSILQSYLKGYSVSVILFALDALVILSGVVVFGVAPSVYAVIAVFISSKIMDEILSGLKVGKQVWIISEQYQQISDEILARLDRGATCLEGVGMYTKNPKKVLLCVTGKRQIVSVVGIVRELDPAAFVIVQDAREVMGEGFGKLL